MRMQVIGWMAATLFCSGCATYDNELLFAESTDIGIGLQPNPVGGAQFNFGYKQRDLALVPIGAIDGTGEVVQRRTKGANGAKDALSVFGQFNASATAGGADAAKRKATLGRFFATGLAAQNLAGGYSKGWKKQTSVDDQAPSQNPSASNPGNAQSPNPKTRPDNSSDNSRTASNGTSWTTPRALRPLVFGQSDTYGLAIGTALNAGEGMFTLGYSGQNIALMPAFAAGVNGRHQSVGGLNSNSGEDAFSVIGQFRAASGIHTIDASLDRFFATGLAAQELSEGLAVRIASELNKGDEQSQ